MANGRNNFNWSEERWKRINIVVHDEASKIRIFRRILPLFGDSNGFKDFIVGHQVSDGPLLSVRAGQTLVPVEISMSFQLAPERGAGVRSCNEAQE